MSDTPGENDSVEQLLTERDALHGWLRRLDAASVTASSGVRDRVRRDYQDRLDRLTESLRQHGDAMESKLAADQAEFSELSARTDTSRDALAEVELRHAVGEYPGDRYESERRQHLSDIETFELSLAAVNERLDRMEEVLALVRRPPGVEPLPTGNTAEGGRSESFTDERTSILDLAPDEASPEPESVAHESIEIVESIEVIESVEIGTLAPEDDSDQLLSVFDEDAAPDSMPADEPSAREVEPVTSEFGPLSFRPSGAAPASEAPAIGMPTNLPPRFIRPGDRLRPTAPAWPSVASTASSEPIPESTTMPQPVPPLGEEEEIFSEEIVATGPAPTAGAGVTRTLRCGECGAMNRPLEWYCEKCGAELTAV